jgi:phosphatidylglycerophosphate synthase
MTAVLPVGRNTTKLWGMTARERLERIAHKQGLELTRDPGEGPILSNVGYVFDPAWLKHIAGLPRHVLTVGGVPVLANCPDLDERLRVIRAMKDMRPIDAPGGLRIMPFEEMGSLENEELRKREKPFLGALAPDTVRPLERASYFGAYKGVTDILTKYLWPEWALVLTRWAARIGMTPNQVTLVGAILCVAATALFYHGWYWAGLAAGLVFMVLDTVDGKLARCTITSSKWGEAFDHGIDLVHPPFWWWAWGAGLHAYGRPLEPEVFWWSLAAIVAAYIVQRLIEGAFIARFGMHIHVWRRFDSRFRLITARRNPNMVILLAFLVAGRPDWGLVAVAAWTVLSLLVHAVQLVQAMIARARGRAIVSWLA